MGFNSGFKGLNMEHIGTNKVNSKAVGIAAFFHSLGVWRNPLSVSD